MSEDRNTWGDGLNQAMGEIAKAHTSCCAVHNEPAYPAGPCDCLVGLPDFRSFYADRNAMRGGPDWAGTVGEPYDAVFRRLAETMADYADEIRKRS